MDRAMSTSGNKKIGTASTKQAQQALKRALEDLFGPKLTGVNGYGAGLDHATHKLSLQVAVDSASSQQLAASLPDVIEGLPVKVTRRGLARFD
jgi:hypothetical protein